MLEEIVNNIRVLADVFILAGSPKPADSIRPEFQESHLLIHRDEGLVGDSHSVTKSTEGDEVSSRMADDCPLAIVDALVVCRVDRTVEIRLDTSNFDNSPPPTT